MKPKTYSAEDLEKAQALVKISGILATSLYIPLLDVHPKLKAIVETNLLKDWDHFVTVACVGTAFMEISDSFPKKNDQSSKAYAVQKALTDWSTDSYKEMADFTEYVYSNETKLTEAIGKWVLKNLRADVEQAPELSQISESLGVAILKTFHNWWDNKNDISQNKDKH